METARERYEAHATCARRLRRALEFGRDLLTSFEVKRPRSAPVRYLRPWRGPRRFRPGVAWWYKAVERCMARQPPFVTGGEWLRQVLDAMLCSQIDREEEARLDPPVPIVFVYMGWSSAPAPKPLSPSTEMTMSDLVLVFRFLDLLRHALDTVDALVAAGASPRAAAEVRHMMALHSRHFDDLEDARRHFAATCVQTAWRRARDTPGFAVWKRRMLREFHEMME